MDKARDHEPIAINQSLRETSQMHKHKLTENKVGVLENMDPDPPILPKPPPASKPNPSHHHPNKT